MPHKSHFLTLMLAHTPPFQNKVTFGHKLRYGMKVTFSEISLKLCQTN